MGGTLGGRIGGGEVHYREGGVRGAGGHIHWGLGGGVGVQAAEQVPGPRGHLALEVGLVEIELHLTDRIIILVIDSDHLRYHS